MHGEDVCLLLESTYIYNMQLSYLNCFTLQNSFF